MATFEGIRPMYERCPFCGSTNLSLVPDVRVKRSQRDGSRGEVPCWRMWCNKCKARGPRKDTRRAAEKAWNNRSLGRAEL